ncbi:P2 family phage major capsid protein [Lonepinella sp. BR2357]|uniref:P2 family phage major capsid protein n=1 Tax=Lonepinella sp. BR2357 TaxID=3434549 RepID=UPI003F6DDA6B
MSLYEKVKETLNGNKTSQNMAKSMKLDADGEPIVINVNQKIERDLFKNIRQNSFFNLINVVKTDYQQGESIGIKLPLIASTLDYDGRAADNAYISQANEFLCKKLSLDYYIPYSKVDAVAKYLEVKLDQAIKILLDRQWVLSLLITGFNHNELSWLKKIRTAKPENVINGTKVGEEQTYKSINALVKAGLEKIGEPLKNSGEFVVLCGRNIIPDHPVLIKYDDLDPDQTAQIIISQKLIGGLRAVNVPYFPENSILITRLDNISIYIQKDTVRYAEYEKPERNRTEIYTSMACDFIIEDCNAAALIENIEIME